MKKLILFFVGCFVCSLGWSQWTAPNSANNINNTNTGSVGINTTSPQAKFHVATNIAGDGIVFTHDGSSYGGSSGFIKLHGPSLGQGSYNGLTMVGDAGIVYGATTQTTNSGFVIVPWTTGASSGVRIDKTGNVGIGTSDTKGYQLAVNGSAIFTKAVVKLFPNWPDYVFQPSYHLPSLDSVAQFIQVNHHLSDMPSADSVAKNGLDLGGNQAALLKKIEELTLYAIDLQKKVERLEVRDKKMDSLQQQIDDLKELLKK